MKIENRYLKLPINRNTESKSLMFLEKGELVMDYAVQLAPNEPENDYYVDVRNLVGKEITFTCNPKTDFIPEFTDSVPSKGIYTEEYRPAAHFSAARGWINDPNGLVWYEGKYHLFFQHNPAGSNWGNMHWGHAVSSDLLHWKELEIALFPDELGTMYSGSAIVDHNNLTGLKENKHDVILLYYTACPSGMKLSAKSMTSQCLAYSTDGGITFKKYCNNPIIPRITDENRDPKVIYVKEEECYYLALYLEGNDFALFRSDDLLHWDKVQEIHFPSAAECPDFYPLTTNLGNRYWVLSDASDRYLIGTLTDGKFIPVQEARRLHHGTKSYAAQTYSNIKDGRKIRISWNQSPAPNSVFNGSMCTPTEMYLTEDESGISLCSRPIKELSAIYAPFEGNSFTGKAQDITLTLDMSENAKASLSLLGLDILIDAKESCLKIKGCSVPLIFENELTTLHIITDTTSVEIYTCDYKAFACVDHIADYSKNSLTLTAIEDCTGIESYSMFELKNIWEG